MTKKEARTLYRKKRDELDPSWRMRADDLILIQFQALELPFLDTVLSFYSIPEKGEVDSFALTDFLNFRNPALQLAYPRMNAADCSMDAIAVAADEAFTENEFGITEPTGRTVINPSDIQLVIVPLLAVDKQGHRIGYGKGYYDRYLAQVSEDCIKIGVSYFESIDVIDDRHAFDIPLDLCITPGQVYVF